MSKNYLPDNLMSDAPPSKLPRLLETNLNRNVCVCYDVTKQQIIDAYQNGAVTFEEVVSQTYACQGSGCCIKQVERLVDTLIEHSPKS